MTNAYNSVYALVYYILSSLLVLYQNERHHLETSNIVINKDHEIIKVKTEAESSVKEQQHMVSSVTHDLKTVRKLNTFYYYLIAVGFLIIF